MKQGIFVTVLFMLLLNSTARSEYTLDEMYWRAIEAGMFVGMGGIQDPEPCRYKGALGGHGTRVLGALISAVGKNFIKGAVLSLTVGYALEQADNYAKENAWLCYYAQCNNGYVVTDVDLSTVVFDDYPFTKQVKYRLEPTQVFGLCFKYTLPIFAADEGDACEGPPQDCGGKLVPPDVLGFFPGGPVFGRGGWPVWMF